MSAAGARVIGFDIVFTDSSSDDQVLASTMLDAGNVILAAVGTQPLPQSKDGITYDNFLLPAIPLQQVAANVGHANVVPDPDGTVRWLPLIVKDNLGQEYPSLTLAILHTLFSMPLPEEYPLSNGTLNLLARDIPVDNSYRLRINFASENESRPYISYGDIIKGDFDASLVRNKIVLIGMTATGELDTWAIPTSASRVPGVLIHATVMDTILNQRFLTEVGIGIILLTLLLMVGIMAAVLPRCGTWYWKDIARGAGITLGLFIAYLVATFLLFDKGYILNILYPVLLLIILYIANILSITVIEQSDKRFVKELFGRYISPQVAKEVVSRADEGKLELTGEAREITILFADIRNFTHISEQLSPEDTVKMLNTYLSVMIDAVLQNGGIINKFAGDSVMAVWNAPQTKLGHAQLAVKSALEAQQSVSKLQHDDSDDLPSVQFGIGINTGQALAGNVGSVGRVEYTVIGDSVNVASRICSATPGGEVWISTGTYLQAKDYLEVEELAPQNYKGKTDAIVVYRAKSWHAPVS